MASYLVQSGTTLQRVSQAGVATTLTLPTGVTLYGSSQLCRMALFGFGSRPVVVVANGGTRDIFVDSSGATYPFSIQPPTSAPVPTAGTGTGLTGVYQVAATFKVKDQYGTTIYETALGPVSVGSASLVNKSLRIDGIPVSSDGVVNSRGLYRTTSGGNILYPWFDIDDNFTLAEDRGSADNTLSILSSTADRNGAAPDLKLIATWGDRLWGVPRITPDFLRWSESRLFYAWPADNEIPVPPTGTDPLGITALIPRRDQLGIARYGKLDQITGYDNDTYTRSRLSESVGCVSQESVVVVRDVAYFLGPRGVVEWSAQSLRYVSEAQVDPWFTSDDVFNRGLFSRAQGRYNPDTDSYELLLAAVNSSNLDRWVSFDLKRRAWFGPHKTDAFTPTCVGSNTEKHGILQSGTTPLVVFGGSDGYLYKRDTSTADDGTSPVSLVVDMPFLGGFDPDRMKVWLQPTIHSRIEGSGSMAVTVKAGELDASAHSAMTHDLTKGRERIGRPGGGRFCQFRLTHSESGVRPRIFGIELPFTITGRR